MDGRVRLAGLADDRHAGAAKFLVVPPGWRPDRARSCRGVQAPARDEAIQAPTPFVWIIGRIKTDGPADYDAVHKLQAGLKLTPLSEWGKDATGAFVKPDPCVDMKTPPKVQVDTMPAAKYFGYAAEVLKLQPPHLTDQPILASLKRMGIEPGKSFDLAKADPAVRQALEAVPETRSS